TGERECLNLPAAISEEFARLILTEFEFSVEGNERADYIQSQMKSFIRNLDKTVEVWCAVGGVALKPYVTGDGDKPDEIAIDIVKANRFFPTAFNSNSEVTGAVFMETKHVGEYIYTRLEYHNLVGDHYTVTNKAYRSKRLNTNYAEDDLVTNAAYLLQEEVSLDSVEEWGELAPEVELDGIEHPLFVYVKVPMANTIDPESPLGPSVYSKAVETIMEADKQYARILWEYEATEAAVDADISVFDLDRNGRPILPEGRERLYRTYDIGTTGEKPFFQEYGPAIRDSNLFNGLNELCRKIEFQCGLAYGTISDVSDTDKTATEIRASKQRSYSKVSRMQKAWDTALDELILVMQIYCDLYNIVPAGDAEKPCSWGDSILEDTEAEYQRRWSMVLAGKMKVEK
ncbi:MAG: phage capsid protein, partial [Clostridiales bacterium]|nr:phage capsid protein [Clostridiales bacterium]